LSRASKIWEILVPWASWNVQFQKISILKFSWGRGVQRDQKIKKSIKYNWNFQRGREVLVKIPSVGEVWIFFWNYTIQFF